MRLGLTLAALVLASPAHAGLLSVDFSQGPLGDLGTPTIEQGSIQVAASGGNLYRWNGYACCDHEDFGLGVLGPTDQINPAQPEIGVGEEITLTRPGNHRWATVYFSSVNTLSQLAILADHIPVAFVFAGAGVFASDTAGGVAIPEGFSTARQLTIRPFGGARDNFSVLWKVDLEKGETVVPEPGTLSLLGLGLLGIARRWRKGV